MEVFHVKIPQFSREKSFTLYMNECENFLNNPNVIAFLFFSLAVLPGTF